MGGADEEHRGIPCSRWCAPLLMDGARQAPAFNCAGRWDATRLALVARLSRGALHRRADCRSKLTRQAITNHLGAGAPRGWCGVSGRSTSAEFAFDAAPVRGGASYLEMVSAGGMRLWGGCGSLWRVTIEKLCPGADFSESDAIPASLRWETREEDRHEGESCSDHSGVRGFDSDSGRFSGTGDTTCRIMAWRDALGEGLPGTAPLVQMNGRSYIDLEALTRLIEGSIAYTQDNVTLTLPFRTRVAPPAEVKQGFRNRFYAQGLKRWR